MMPRYAVRKGYIGEGRHRNTTFAVLHCDVATREEAERLWEMVFASIDNMILSREIVVRELDDQVYRPFYGYYINASEGIGLPFDYSDYPDVATLYQERLDETSR